MTPAVALLALITGVAAGATPDDQRAAMERVANALAEPQVDVLQHPPTDGRRRLEGTWREGGGTQAALALLAEASLFEGSVPVLLRLPDGRSRTLRLHPEALDAWYALLDLRFEAVRLLEEGAARRTVVVRARRSGGLGLDLQAPPVLHLPTADAPADQETATWQALGAALGPTPAVLSHGLLAVAVDTPQTCAAAEGPARHLHQTVGRREALLDLARSLHCQHRAHEALDALAAYEALGGDPLQAAPLREAVQASLARLVLHRPQDLGEVEVRGPWGIQTVRFEEGIATLEGLDPVPHQVTLDLPPGWEPSRDLLVTLDPGETRRVDLVVEATQWVEVEVPPVPWGWEVRLAGTAVEGGRHAVPVRGAVLEVEAPDAPPFASPLEGLEDGAIALPTLLRLVGPLPAQLRVDGAAVTPAERLWLGPEQADTLAVQAYLPGKGRWEGSLPPATDGERPLVLHRAGFLAPERRRAHRRARAASWTSGLLTVGLGAGGLASAVTSWSAWKKAEEAAERATEAESWTSWAFYVERRDRDVRRSRTAAIGAAVAATTSIGLGLTIHLPSRRRAEDAGEALDESFHRLPEEP